MVFSVTPYQDKNKSRLIDRVQNLEKKEGKYAKTLAKIQITAIFVKRVMRRNVLPKLIIKSTISSIVIGLKNSYFPLIHLSSVIGQFVIGHLVIGQFVIGQFNKPITLKVIVKIN